MPGTATPSVTARASSPVTNLLTELHHADTIIKVMLNAITAQQKARVGAQLEAAGVAGDGMTRHHERAAAIAAAAAEPTVACNYPHRTHLLGIEALATDIDGQGEHIEILLDALLGKLDELSGPGAEPAAAAINCFATCALRNAVLMREASDQIHEHVEAGMAHRGEA